MANRQPETEESPSSWHLATTSPIGRNGPLAPSSMSLSREIAPRRGLWSRRALTAAALAHCAYRRVIRTRRVDYRRRAPPRRRHRPLVVEPLGAEADRQSLMWQYFGPPQRTRAGEFDSVLLAKRVVLSPPSLEQRVDFLRREGHERAGLLERVKPLVNRSQG